MPISSVIVRSSTEDVPIVAQAVKDIPNADVTTVSGENLIVVTQTDSREKDKQLWNTLEALPNVIGLDLIYYNFEDLEENTDETN